MEDGNEDFKARFERLRTNNGLAGTSIADLYYVGRRRLEEAGRTAVSQSLVEKRLAPKDQRPPTIALLELLAAAVGVDPVEFPEYRLALARRQFDEREVGLGQALENLERLESAMRKRPRRATPRAGEPEATSPQLRQAGRPGRATRKGG